VSASSQWWLAQRVLLPRLQSCELSDWRMSVGSSGEWMAVRVEARQREQRLELVLGSRADKLGAARQTGKRSVRVCYESAEERDLEYPEEVYRHHAVRRTNPRGGRLAGIQSTPGLRGGLALASIFRAPSGMGGETVT
jgi:hypothetical protein